MGREEHRRLAGRVPRADDLDIQAMGVRRLAARGPVEDPPAHEPVEPVDLEPPPRDAAGEDDRARAQDVAAVEVHVTGRRVDPRDRARDEDLGTQPVCLLERPAGQFAARDARGEAEVVLDPRGRARLPSRRLALDRDRSQAFGRAVDGGCQTGRSSADDHGVVLRGRRLGRDVEELGHPAHLRAHHGLAVHDAKGGVVTIRRQRAPPLLRVGGHVRLKPPEPHLIAGQEVPSSAQAASRRWPRTIAW